MAILYLSPINLGKLELQNARIHNLAAAPTSPVAGQIYYNTADATMYFWNGSAWVDIKGDIQAVVAGSGLTGGGSGGSVTLNVGAGTGITVTTDAVGLDTANTRNIDHAGLDVVAGNGLTGGGELTGDVTLHVAATASSGITVGANAIELSNYANLTQNTILMWGAGGQLENAPIVRTVDQSSNETITINGSLIVTGTTTSVNSNEVNIGDAIIKLNSDETGTPSQNGGFEIERGTSANVSFIWNEANDYFSTVNQPLHVGSVESHNIVNADFFYIEDNSVGNTGIIKKTPTGQVAALLGAPKYYTLDPAQGNVAKTGNVYTITHTFATKAVMVQIMDTTTYETVMVDVARPSTSTVTVSFASAVTDGAYIAILSAAKLNGDTTTGAEPGDGLPTSGS
jgi:hypothetical protein